MIAQFVRGMDLDAFRQDPKRLPRSSASFRLSAIGAYRLLAVVDDLPPLKFSVLRALTPPQANSGVGARRK
jgi:hypothetical protein